MLKIIIAEDHKLVRDGIKMLLSTESTLEIVAEAADGQAVLDSLAEGKRADIILSDMNMPVMDGMTMLKAINSQYPEVKVIFLSMLDNPKYAVDALKFGAHGYLFKNVSAEELIFAIKYVNHGERYICSELSLTLLEQFTKDDLLTDFHQNGVEFSERELEVLRLIAEGMTNLEMAEKLFISKRTVEGHRQSLLEKTGSRNTATLIRSAVTHKLI